MTHGASVRITVIAAAVWAATAAVDAAETGDLAALRAEALALVNEARRGGGLDPLAPTDRLNRAAQRHAEDMLTRGYYGHASPEGERVGDRYRDLGGSRWKLVAENIAECRDCKAVPTLDRVRQFQRGWMQSPPHHANIMHRGLEGFGFGIVAGEGGRILAVQTFAGPGVPRGLDPDEARTVLSPTEQAQRALRAVNREREREGLAALQASGDLDEAAASLLPEGDEMPFAGSGGTIRLPPGVDARRWLSLRTAAGVCGGCGTEPTAADIRYFTDRWLEAGKYREMMLARDASHLGFAMRASGEGRKTAVAMVGTAR